LRVDHVDLIEKEKQLNDRILFVDDEKKVLDGYKRLLHGVFDVETAVGGTQALAELHIFGPYAIVISDMRMPGMNGAEFLAQVRQIAPNTVRMLLTGYKDADEAADAVNKGRIFRYLTKPCKKSDLVLAINLGLEQYRRNVDDRQAINQARTIRLQAATLNDLLLARKLG
jgi:DNA-binding NtrC family response regulator